MYNYKEMKFEVFKEENQENFLKVRDKARELCQIAGCARMDKLIEGLGGDNWTLLALVDRLVEIGTLEEVTNPDNVPGQYRIFRMKRD